MNLPYPTHPEPTYNLTLALVWVYDCYSIGAIAKGKTMTHQRMQTFWLDADKPEDLRLINMIPDLKRRNKFAPLVRDGLRLVLDLRAGKVDVLLELFPWIQEAMRNPSTPDNDELLRRLDEMEKNLLEQGHIPPPPPGYPQMKNAGGPGAIRPMNVPHFDLPRFEDDDNETVVIKRDTSTGSGENFLKSVAALLQQ